MCPYMDPNVGSKEETGKRRNEVECRNDFISSKEGHRMTYHKHRTDITELRITGVEKKHL